MTAANLTSPFSSFKASIKAWIASSGSKLWLPKTLAAANLTFPFSSFKYLIKAWIASSGSEFWAPKALAAAELTSQSLSFKAVDQGLDRVVWRRILAA